MSCDVLIEGAGVTITCAPGETILHAALKAGLGFPYDCGSGGCGTCRFQKVSGEFSMKWPEAPGLSARDRARGDRLLGCQATVNSHATIRVMLEQRCEPKILPMQTKAVLHRSRQISHDMIEFEFRTAGSAHFLPGQYALLSTPEVRGARAYSMSNLPNEEGAWRFVVKRKRGGEFTNWLFEGAQTERAVELSGPYGLAHVRSESEKHAVCIAGGSGLSPMLSIAQHILGQDSKQNVSLFYGCRTANDAFDLSLFPMLVGQERLRFITVISDADSTWEGQKGFVHEAAIRDIGPSLQEADIYIAGPPPMTEATLNALHDLGIDRHSIYFDSFL